MLAFPGGAVVKNPHASVGDTWDRSLIPGSGRSPGVGNSNLLQYSCLENLMDRGAWQAAVHGVSKRRTRLSDWAHTSTISRSLLKFMSIELVMPSNHIILCLPLLLLPSIFPSIRVFSDELALHIRWPKYWSFSFSISLSNEYPGLISFSIDWFDRHAVQGENHNSKRYMCSLHYLQ